MNNINKLTLILMAFIIFSSCTKNNISKKAKSTDKYPNRIITLAPALTEIAFALGAGDKIVGNTKFCKYPKEATNIKKIGGFLDMNIEMILKLKPDLIICYPEHKNNLKILKGKIKLLEVKHINISDIFNSISLIGKEINKSNESENLIKSIKTKLYKNNNFKKKTVLLIADRDPHRLKSMYIIGRKGFLNEILNLSGGKNAYQGNIPYPSISIESIVSMNPDIIIEFSFLINNQKKKNILKEWDKYSMINAVKTQNIFFAKGDYWQKPGPRIVKISEELKRIIN